MFETILQVDKQVLIFLNNLGTEQWDPFWRAVTKQFNWIPLFATIIFLVIKAFGWKRGGFIILSMIILVAFSDQFTNLIKNFIERLRPNNNPQIKDLLRTVDGYSPGGYSFMSGHATTSTFFTVYTLLLLKDKYQKYIYLMLIFPLVFSYSRLYLGVHFPIDILTGITIGIIFANLYFTLYKKVDQRLFKV